MGEDGYCGWKNYTTWCVALWIGNDEWLDREFQNSARTMDERELVDYIKSTIEEDMPKLSGMWADLLQSAYDDCDFYEIAAAYIADCADEEDEDESKEDEIEYDETVYSLKSEED